MNTIERVKALSLATGINEDDLIGVIQKELGHTHALDEFIPYGNIHAKALANSPILHIVAGNTPEAAIQSLTRGLLIGAQNLVKLPKTGLDDFDSFMMKLPSELVNLIETSSDREIVDEWISFSKVVIVLGSDETVFDVSRKMTSTQTLISHNHKISIAVVHSDPTQEAAGLAAIDIHKFDQMG
ncbi:MAG: acyl-CoA reductase, partial [Verrucomicrobiota bacterium]|nr:acyl-CoA reductase [Verrucomicrobiota bacterium]